MTVQFPLIERGPINEFYVDGAYRLENMGSMFHKYYFRYARDAQINGGAIFRVPVLRMIWTREHFILNAGNGLTALQTGRQEIPHLAPASMREQFDMN